MLCPVFVDLDGTLISDTSTKLQLRSHIFSFGIFQTLRELIRIRPFNRFEIKRLLAASDSKVEYENYFRGNVLSLLKDFESEGRLIVLATGSLTSTGAFAIMRYPVHIHSVLGSAATTTLKGKYKLDAIIQFLNQFGFESFIYVGDSMVDLKIMKEAKESYFVGKQIVFLLAVRIFGIKQILKI